MRISDWSSDVCSSDLRQGQSPLCRQRGDDRQADHYGPQPLQHQEAQPGRGVEASTQGREVGPVPRAHFPIREADPSNRSEEHTSELQSLMRISYAVFCLKNKITNTTNTISISQQKNHKLHNTIKSRNTT